MTVETKYQLLVGTIKGKKDGLEIFLNDLTPESDRFEIVKKSRVVLQELNELLQTIENFDK